MNLTKAQDERLTLLQEECAEVIKEASKIKRFGFDSRYPQDGPSNLENLETELGGLAAVITLLIDAQDINEDHCEAAQLTKQGTIHKYTKFQLENEETNVG